MQKDCGYSRTELASLNKAGENAPDCGQWALTTLPRHYFASVLGTPQFAPKGQPSIARGVNRW